MATATVESSPATYLRSKETGEIKPLAPVREDPLAIMRKPFAPNQISKMCKSTRKDNQPGRCRDCGGFHKLPSVPISYVGHAALTDRLLDADPKWTWEPLSLAPDGTPLLDNDGGMWIKLTVAGVTRLGYGDAQGKTGGDAMKERIGDALRNAAMRFGAALELWHKGELHVVAKETEGEAIEAPSVEISKETIAEQCEWIANAKDMAELQQLYFNAYKQAAQINDKAAMAAYIKAKDARKKELQ